MESQMQKSNIKNLSIEELSRELHNLGEPRYRLKQLLQWLYQKGAASFFDMSNIPMETRTLLDERYIITSLKLIESVRSSIDASQKFLLETGDGELLEAVLMEARGKKTICISCQVGCPLGCRFCRTGDGGFVRSLRSDEMLDQVLFFKMHHLERNRRFNIVFMGMGEPFLNLDDVEKSIQILNAIDGFALREKRITISTIGIPEAMRRISRTDLKFGLALSLNATTDRVRKQLMPAADDIAPTLAAAEEFARTRETRVTLEYVLISGVNDRREDARRLARLTSGKPFKINLIPFNAWEGSPYGPPAEADLERFVEILLPTAPAVTVRRSQGNDIDAACGQLSLRRRSGGRRDSI
jgi:23S rRNA (adenine2503-C2)-methyltransferase